MHGIVFYYKSKIYGSNGYELKEFVVQNRWIPLCLCERMNLQCLLYQFLVYHRNIVDYKHIKSQIFMFIPFDNSFVKCDRAVRGTKAQT